MIGNKLLAVLPSPHLREGSQQGKHMDTELQKLSRNNLSKRLIIALRDSHEALASQILNEDINPNYLDERKTSPLMIAAYRGFADICQKLIDLGADPLYGFDVISEDSVEFDCVSDRAQMSNDPRTIEIVKRAFILAGWRHALSHSKDDPSWLQYFGAEHLSEAAYLGMTQLVIEMIHQGIPIDNLSTPAESALMMAGYGGHFNLCAILASLGANLDRFWKHESVTKEFVEVLANLQHQLLLSTKYTCQHENDSNLTF